MSFLSGLQLLLIGLQLAGLINWSWLLVLAPTIIPLALAVLFVVAAWIVKWID